MYMQIRLPLVCFLIVAYCFLQYSQKKRLKARSSEVFSAWMVALIFNLAATTVTEYTVNNRDAVPEMSNYVWHVLFIVSLTVTISLLLFYQLLMIERSTGKHQSREKSALFIVALLGIVTQIILPIEYIDTPQGSYSLGPKAYSLYVVVIFDLVMLIWKSLRYRRALGVGKSNLMMTSTAIYILAACIQIYKPYLLVTDAALTLIAVGLTVSTEDNFLYINQKTNLFNDLACREIICERLFDGKPFRVGMYVFMGDDAAIDDAMVRLTREIKAENSHLMCGVMSEHLLVVLPLSKWTGEAALPERLPQPESARMTFRYKTDILEFGGDEDVDTVQSTIRDLQLRYEAEDLQIDELTRLLRREAFIYQVNGMLERGTPFSLLMIDLDNFKTINDSFGHHVGDLVLQGSADVFRSLVRTSDLLCRIGGDEFAIALSGAIGQEEISQIVDRMMERLGHMDVLPEGDCKVRVSVGVKSYVPQEGPATFQDIYAQADSALYEIKKSGKNGVSFWERT